MFIASYQPKYKEQFKDLVSKVLNEFGFSVEPQLDSDLDNPETAYMQPGGAIFLLEHEGKIFGCCAIKPLNSKSAEIKRLYLDKAVRRRGYGKQLLDTAIEYCQQMSYTRLVLDSHIRFSQATRFYKRNGFSPMKQEEDVIIFERILY